MPSSKPVQATLQGLPASMRVPARFWYNRLRGALEPELLPAISASRQGGTVAVDVGAHWGLYTYAMRRAFREVYAFEPLDECLEFLRTYDQPEIQLHACCLSDHDGNSSLMVPIAEDGRLLQGNASLENREAGLERIVPTRTLDSFDLSDVALIKIDTEGHEISVLEGASELLGREKPYLLVEVEDAHSAEAAWDRIERISSYGYEAFVLDGGGWVKATPDRTKPDGDRYRNNFFFRPA